MYAYSRMDFGVKTAGRIFSNVVHVQLNTSLHSQLTALQRAHAIVAGFGPKPTSVF